jgi:AAA family ATP:ADP antiporter
VVQGILADVSIATGYATIALMLAGRFVFQFLGWRVAAMATPAVMFVTGGAFFGLSIAATMGGSSLTVGHFNMASAGAIAGAVTQASTPPLFPVRSQNPPKFAR